MPPGLSVSSNGTIAGTPATPGTYPVVVALKDADSQEATKTLPIEIQDADEALSINTTKLPLGFVDEPYLEESGYAVQVKATGGTSPYRWSAAGLPDGISISTDGTITGTPTIGGDYPCDINVQDSDSPTGTDTKEIWLPVQARETPDDCGSQGDLYDIREPNVVPRSALDIFKMDQGSSGLGLSRLTGGGETVKPKPIADKNSNGKYVGRVCVPRIRTIPTTCWVANAQLHWTTGNPGASNGDITANTIAQATAHEKAHIKVFQSAGKRMSKYYGEKVFTIRTKAYSTEAEALAKATELEQKFWQDCHNAFAAIAKKYNAKHFPATIRKYGGGSSLEWFLANPDWFTSQGLDAQIQTEAVNVPVPSDP